MICYWRSKDPYWGSVENETPYKCLVGNEEGLYGMLLVCSEENHQDLESLSNYRLCTECGRQISLKNLDQRSYGRIVLFGVTSERF